MSAAIEVRDVFRVHQTAEGDAAALQGLSLTVREHETVTVLGPSGSGKSTLLRLLAGLDRPSAGTIRVFGTELGKLPARDVARFRTRTVGYADQHYARALAPELSARELVGLELGLAGATPAERNRRADDLLERVGLADKRDARPAELSGGEQQRVAVAVALSNLPMILLADEPTAELDSESAALVLDAFQSVNHEFGVTIVMVTHDLLAAKRAHRQLRLRDGQLLVEGRPMEPLGTDGRARLPDEAIDALSGVDLEVEVRDGEVRIRRKGEGGLIGE